MKFAFLFITVAVASSAWAAGEKPNVVFILADDLGWSDTTLNGTTKFYRTPNLERLAKRGMTFKRAYSASPLCSPTRSAILTGLSPARTGITTPNCHLPQVVLEATIGKAAPPNQKSIQPTPVTRLKTEYRTLAESLKEAGYATGHFGKWGMVQTWVAAGVSGKALAAGSAKGPAASALPLTSSRTSYLMTPRFEPCRK